MKQLVTIFALIIFISACTTTEHLQPADADLFLAQQRIPGITMTDLQRGYKMYSLNCSGCHRLHDPVEYTAGQWKPILDKMFVKARLSDDRQKQLISNYLVAKSK